MIKETKNEVYDLIVKCTFEFCNNQILKCDSNYLCQELNISRSLSSQYLNEYFKAGVFLKVHSRPVYFLDKHTIESVHQMKLDHNEFYDVNELIEQFGKVIMTKRSFLKAVGHDTSLSECIMQCQSAVKYPPNGLPMLLYGEHGVGKTYFTKLIHQYAIEENIIDDDAKLVTFSENTYMDINMAQKDEDIIFGTYLDGSDRYLGGLIAKAKNGILVIDNVEKLSGQCYFRLMQFMQSGEYTIRGKQHSKIFKSKTRLIFTSCLVSNEHISSAFFHNIPVICHIPNLQDRPMEDKEMLIVEFLKEEGMHLKKDIMISNKALLALVNHQYPNNIEELAVCIQTSCANAYLTTDNNAACVQLYLYHLPVSIINGIAIDKQHDEEEYMIDICKYIPQTKNGRILEFFDFLISAYQEYVKHTIDIKQFNDRCIESMNVYYDYIVFEHKYYNARVKAYEKAVMDVFENMLDRYDIYIPTNCAFVVARVIYSYMQMFSSIRSYEVLHAEDIHRISQVMNDIYPQGYHSALEIVNKIRQTIDVEINEMNFIFLILNIQFYNRSIDKYKYNCVIISHGYSTASSMADAVNKLVGNHMMEGIDMPVNTEVEEVVQILKKYIAYNSIHKDLILLVDMGSLEHIGKQIADEVNISIGIINNVSTKLALHVAYQIRHNDEMKAILEKTSTGSMSEYKMFQSKKKKKSIIFTSETGVEAIERIVQLFKSSMPRQIDVSIFAYDYLKLQKNLELDEIFSLYDVLFIVGTTQVTIPSVPFIKIEDVIAFKDIDCITSLMNCYFTKVEQDQFNRNLIKNFTLENVMNYLTVLNADKLISYIEEALDHLQNLLGIILSNEVIIGMYIHISCIIERLMMKNDAMIIARDKEMNADQKRFQKLFLDSFAKIMEYYKVEIPKSEILYLYDYIDKK